LESRLDKRSARARKAKQLLRQLAQDPNPWIRAEAGGHLRELRAPPPRTLPVIQQRLAERDYIGFFSVSISVSNYLSITGASDYTDAMVDDMACWLEQRPLLPGEDREAYYHAFGDFHENMR